jgi:lipoyl(octanoyl) transferase
MLTEILAVRCGIVPYKQAWDLQRALAARRQAGEIADVLLLLEHPPVYTRGRRSQPEELPMGADWYEAQGIEVLDTDRGGLVTYHGPGQLVAYPIVDLAGHGGDIHEYVRSLERVMIGALGEAGVPAQTIAGLTGVWTDPAAIPPRQRSENGPMWSEIGPSAGEVDRQIGPPAAKPARKIGSIGLHVSRGVTTHGLAVNVNNDLQPFEWIVPCGIEGVSMTSLTRELGAEQDLDRFATTLVARYGEILERRPVPTAPAEIGLQLSAATLRESR